MNELREIRFAWPMVRFEIDTPYHNLGDRHRLALVDMLEKSKYVRMKRGEYGHVILHVAPLVDGPTVIFENATSPDRIPEPYYKAVLRCIRDFCLEHGHWGYPKAGLHVTLAG